MPASTSAPAPIHPTYAIGTGLFLRLLGLVHLFAFLSAWVQIDGLIGPNGIQPAGDFLRAVHAQLGSGAFWQLPTLAWWFGSGSFLHVLCGAGVIFSLLLIIGIIPGPSLIALWVTYLSLANIGQLFFGFQWDSLLIEATVMALFVVPWKLWPLWGAYEPPAFGRWLVIWLGFRLMFLSGVVKLTSGDPTWANFTALDYHFETQPLPNPLSWHIHFLSPWVRHFACIAMLAVEWLLVWLVFVPSRHARRIGAFAVIGLMIAIEFTGNYTFFNLLVAILFLPAIDDQFWRWLFRQTSSPSLQPSASRRSSRWLRTSVLSMVIIFTAIQALPAFSRKISFPAPLNSLYEVIAPFRTLNTYGVFAVMTTLRPELIIEGSADGVVWREYGFHYKPSALSDPLRWVAPHQPRLDWQLWFAALSQPAQNRWVENLCAQLLRSSPAVIDLLAHNPFPQNPPRYLRVLRYRYQYNPPSERARTGQLWSRTLIDTYVPPVSLR